MKSSEKILQLKSIIEKSLTPLINGDYVLYGLPYYTNIGDTLIWEGELEFLNTIPHKCVGSCGWNDYPITQLNKDIVILITGGGYFGDVWRNAWENVLAGIQNFKENRIIFLPNSIFYNDVSVLNADVRYLSEFKNIIICARDKYSYDFARRNFKNQALLIPDMAFCISPQKLRKYLKPKENKTLYLKRIDKEIVSESIINTNENGMDINDWPTMDNPTKFQYGIESIIYHVHSLAKRNYISNKFEKDICAFLYKHLYRKYMIFAGVRFISRYNHIITTRLHAMILSILLDRNVEYIDNSYGKLGNFYNTWLSDCNIVKEYHK